MHSRSPVLIVTYAYPPDPFIGGWRPFRFQKYLSRLGHPVRVLSVTPEATVQIDDYIHRLPGEVPGASRKSFALYLDIALRTFIFYDEGALWVPRAVRYANRWKRELPKSVLLSTSPPIHTHLAAYLLKKRHNMRWIADFRDPMTGNPSRKRSRSRHFDPYFERLFVTNADLIIANTDIVAETWRARYPEAAHKIRLIWNGFDPEDFEDVPPPPERGYKLITHVGTIYAGRDPLYMLSAVRRLVERGRLNPRAFRIDFYGQISEPIRSNQETFARLIEIGCLSHEPKEPDKYRSQEIMRESDSLLLIDFREEARLQVPAKLFFYVRTGRPVIACTLPNSPSERILARCGLPSVCLHPEDSPERLEAGVLEAINMPSTDHRPSDWFFENFDSARQTEMLSQYIEEIAAPRPAVEVAAFV